MKVKSVIIVGGGSSGWMTAAAFVRNMPDVKLTLIESPTVPTIGVGESTLGQIHEYMTLIGLKDEEWMADCNAAYKTSIKFTDFRENPGEKPHSFHYPFGNMYLDDKPGKEMEWFKMKCFHPDIPPENMAEYYHDSVLMTDAGKLTHNYNRALKGFQFNYDTAYHMDAALFGQWLKNNICIPGGMTYYSDDCTEFVRDSNTGELDHIKTKNSGNLKADLYIDCTGFASRILENTMGSKFYSFKSHGLKNDRAVATIIPYIDKEKEMETVTNCTAIDNGWVWNIPLWNRIGTGYVYSSDYATEQEAEEQFRRHLASNRMVCPDAERAKNAQFRHIKIRHGCHEKAWVQNVVGVGLSNGFIEPLESTGLLLTHFTIVKLINALQMRDGNITCLDRDMFNMAVFTEVGTFRDFVAQHYALSNRDDTQYWRDCKNNTVYCQQLSSGIRDPWSTYTGLTNAIYLNRDIARDIGGIFYIFAGMGYNPESLKHMEYVGHTAVEEYCKETARKHWEERRAATMKIIDKLPSHYQFLQENIYNKDA